VDTVPGEAKDKSNVNRDASEIGKPWFSGRTVEVLIYKINRRPMTGDPSLFKAPEDLLAHIKSVLEKGEPATSGRNPKRTWQIGNLEYDHKRREFTGHLGWARTAEALSQSWDPINQMWIDKVVEREDSAVAPLVFIEKGRLLGILKHPTFTTEIVLDKVLTEIFNRGERNSGSYATAWDIEPVGDEHEFLTWMSDLDQLTSLTLTFQRPNPDGEELFNDLFARLDALRAKSITEKYTALDREEGLDRQAISNDKTSQGFIRAAMIAFGRVLARGNKDGARVKYDQRESVLRAPITDVGDDWNTATTNVLRAVRNIGKEQD